MKNIMKTGGLPTGTFNKPVNNSEEIEVDPMILANMRAVMAGGEWVLNYDTNEYEFKAL